MFVLAFLDTNDVARGLFLESPETFSDPTHFKKLIFLHVSNVRENKRIPKFEGLEPRRCEDIN